MFVSVGILNERIRCCERGREGVYCPIERPKDEAEHSTQLSGHALKMSDVEVLIGSNSATTRGKTKICGTSVKILEDDFGAGIMDGEPAHTGNRQGPWGQDRRRGDMSGDMDGSRRGRRGDRRSMSWSARSRDG